MDIDDAYLGSVPPVEVHATNCRMVNVNVQITLADRPPDTLRRMAEAIEERMAARISERME